VWVLGTVAIGLNAALAFYFFTWSNQHRNLLESTASWQAAFKRSEALIVEAANKLPVGVFVDFRDPVVMRRFTEATLELRDDLSPEEIDAQLANTALLRAVPSGIFIGLGNYFRFRAHRSFPHNRELRESDLWCAIRRYRRARDVAQTESGSRARTMAAHAVHGIAICLLQLDRHGEALSFAKEAAKHFKGELGVSDTVASLDTYGLALKRLSRFEEAVKQFREALQRGRGDTSATYNLACCYARWGDADALTRAEKYREALKCVEELSRSTRAEDKHCIAHIATDEDFEQMTLEPACRTEFDRHVAELTRRLQI
jgi:tetratricopeptide (TPR) repeat protein